MFVVFSRIQTLIEFAWVLQVIVAFGYKKMTLKILTRAFITLQKATFVCKYKFLHFQSIL